MLTLLLLYLQPLCQSCCVSRYLDAVNETYLSYFKMHRLFALILEIRVFQFDSPAQSMHRHLCISNQL